MEEPGRLYLPRSECDSFEGFCGASGGDNSDDIKRDRASAELAREKQVKGMVYLSSMEAYGVVDPEHYNVKETDYGYIDPLRCEGSYSE